MSAEPGRKAPYSRDIRWRVVWQRIGMELEFRDIAKNLCLSVGTVHDHFKRFEDTGDVLPIPIQGGKRILNDNQELLLIGLLLDNPALYLNEVCQKIEVLVSLQQQFVEF